MPPEDRDPTVELFESIRDGGQASSVLKLLKPMLTEEKERILIALSDAKPDLGFYAKLAGAAMILRRLERSLEIKKADGDAASEMLNKGAG